MIAAADTRRLLVLVHLQLYKEQLLSQYRDLRDMREGLGIIRVRIYPLCGQSVAYIRGKLTK